MTEDIVRLILVFAATLFVFLLIRAIVLWYFRIDAIVLELEKHSRILIEILKRLETSEVQNVIKPGQSVEL